MEKHIFIDHSNIWGGARLSSKIQSPGKKDIDARISVKNLNRVLGGNANNVATKIVSGGIPPGMEGVWTEYQACGYDTQRLFRDANWKERGVDHSLIGHMWRLATKNRTKPTELVLASGDGKVNEFGTSFFEILELVLKDDAEYASWSVTVATFDWDRTQMRAATPTSSKIRNLVQSSTRGKLLNLFAHYASIVYHQAHHV
ncbi:MAG: hypothetical protein ACK5TK_18545 [Betaproteobacteria bacterium]